jgi:hypothetical protein
VADFAMLYPKLAGTVGSATTGQIAQDSTYVWFTTRESSGDAKLWRMRKSDKALIKPDGTVGNAGNAYVVLDTGTAAYDRAIVATGTDVLVPMSASAGRGVRRYSATNMADLGLVLPSVGWGGQGGYYNDGNNLAAILFGGYAYFCYSNSTTGVARLNVTTWAVDYYTFPQLNGWASNGTNLWASAGTGVLYKLDAAMNTVASYAGTGCNWLTYDSVNGYMWIGGAGAYSVMRLRISDGAFIKSDGTVGDATTARTQAGSINGSVGGWAVDGQLFVAQPTRGLIARVLASGDPTQQIQGVMTPSFGTGGGPNFFLNDPTTNTLYWSNFGNGAWITGGVGYLSYDGSSIPELTNVDPGTGPHLTLTFSSAVDALATDIGSAADGVGVTGVTQMSSVVVDLNLAVRPDHPSGEGEATTLTPPLGEADNLGPPVPTGIGATVI